jgi:hypothetical protein
VDRIKTAKTSGLFLQEIALFYPEDWCTYYEQADLARQRGDWEAVAKYWSEAQKKGFTPGSSFETLPFIEAFAHLGEWTQAADISLQFKNSPPASRYTLCDFWEGLPASPERDAALKPIHDELKCANK